MLINKAEVPPPPQACRLTRRIRWFKSTYDYPFIGFTLAEVLITLAIIGVVAALTLPSVINKAQDKQFKAMFKKQYSVIAQAIQLIYAKEDTYIAPQANDWEKMPYYVCAIGKELKSIGSGIKCEVISNSQDYTINSIPKNPNIHWHKSEEWFDKTGKPIGLNGNTKGYGTLTFLLPDGAMINFNCSNEVFIDVNGYKKPNTVGRDIFYFFIKNNQFAPVFWTSEKGNNINGCSCPDSCTKVTPDNYKEDCESGSGWGCSPLYIME